MQSNIYNKEGKEIGKVKLPESVFGLKWNADLVHEVVRLMLSNSRKPVAHTKNRGEVRGGGKKPWQQKGTGRARHGSSRSPLWVGGGVTHGPRNDKNFARKINRKAKAKALASILSAKFRDGEIIFVDAIAPSKPKTKEAAQIMKALGSIPAYAAIANKKNNSAYIALCKKYVATGRSFTNIGSVTVAELRNLNPVDVLQYKYVILDNPSESVPFLEKHLAN